MSNSALLKKWKHPSILLCSIGISNVGEWIYFIALNLMVLSITESPLAVGALYMIRPLATLFTNLWAGSLIDRLQKRNLMVFLDVFRGGLLVLLPLSSSIWYIFAVVFVFSMASSIFRPTAMVFITKLVPVALRPRFNSLHSLISSGAFLIGPATAGILFLIASPEVAIYINAIALIFSGIITLLIPSMEDERDPLSVNHRMSMEELNKDWHVVIKFYRENFYVMLICLLFGIVIIVFASAVDSLEASFATLVLHLSEGEYGVLVSIAGAGIIVGAIINTLVVTKVKVSVMIGFGAVGTCLGYMIYAFSHSFLQAAVGFFVLAFFLAFANTGFSTFYQNNISSGVMGRVGSFNDFIQAVLVIVMTAIVAVAAEYTSIQVVVIVSVLFMAALSLMLCLCIFKPTKSKYYDIGAGNTL
ncbi:MFS transporter [Aureibacillus halotolerans]|uniref:Sugar phosphate permease n=1 Tax=Aureibacillus halotolerans TaxID=1508390 RepID=A0A4R6TQI9_9BACI|nr:MFS transporter [Aureibacillus halotolerans]TDQ33714.1 sugar phosphate permease [Aureibacillus halotolerans]